MTKADRSDQVYVEKLHLGKSMAKIPAYSKVAKGSSIEGHCERRSCAMIQNRAVPMIYPNRAHWMPMNQRSDGPLEYVAQDVGLQSHKEVVGYAH